MTTIDAKEIQNFAKDSSHWWDESGPFAPLHRLNPVRLSYIKHQICTHFSRDEKSLKPFTRLSLLDVGCGGGLVCEPMARLGATVTGADADENAIAVAKVHGRGLNIDYIVGSTETLIKSSPKKTAHRAQFDVVLALEIVEHVTDMDAFVGQCLSLCKEGGIVIFSTLNRTPKSFMLGKIAAEYILGWVPKGTHDWKKFVRPSELARAVRNAGGTALNVEGLAFSPMTAEFKRSSNDLEVNYFMAVGKG